MVQLVMLEERKSARLRRHRVIRGTTVVNTITCYASASSSFSSLGSERQKLRLGSILSNLTHGPIENCNRVAGRWRYGFRSSLYVQYNTFSDICKQYQRGRNGDEGGTMASKGDGGSMSKAERQHLHACASFGGSGDSDY